MESLRGRCRIVTVILIVILALSPVGALAEVSLLHYLYGISSGQPVDDARAARIDIGGGIVGILQLCAFLGCAVAFLVWFHRAHKNLQAGVDHLRYTPAWAVGGFFVPFLNLVRPFQVMREIWGCSSHLPSHRKDGFRRVVSPSPLVGWWWGLYLSSAFVGQAAGRLTLRADELGEFIVAGWFGLASNLLDIPATLFAFLLVRRVTELKEGPLVDLKNELRRAGPE